jgi:hypothetical protein
LPPITPENEKRLIYALMEDLNRNFGVGIDPCPSLERGAVTQVIDSKQGRLVLVGASHMSRLAGVMGPRAVSLAYRGFRPREPMLTELIEQLKTLNLGKLDTVVVDLLSNTAFMGTDASGLPSESVRAEGGKYHITGSLTIAPPTLTKRFCWTPSHWLRH